MVAGRSQLAASEGLEMVKRKRTHIHFLHIARGSLYETMTLLNLFQRRDWISTDAISTLEAQSNTLARMLNALIRSIIPD
jgi:four helix bundle protein